MLCGAAVVATAPAYAAQAAAAAPPSTPPAAPQPAAGAVDMTRAKLTFESTCSGCHDPSLATSQRNSRAGWEALVERMVGFGLTASDAQRHEIVEYLTATYPAP
jgi:mono/diheme cytochrome c family protein